MKIKTGNVDGIEIKGSCCGIRFDPEQLSEDTGFNFSVIQGVAERDDKVDSNADDAISEGVKTNKVR